MRARVEVRGIVQGVGFRPFVYRLAHRHRLGGHVRNMGDATVEIVVQGDPSMIKGFLIGLKDEKPPLARIESMRIELLSDDPKVEHFEILGSSERASASGSVIPPDVAICDRCMGELLDPGDRRYLYFFITCTDCGPRFTVIEALPYDRERTTMKDFGMCPPCGKEYRDPLSRRFHAQTIACAPCGPKAMLYDRDRKPLIDDSVKAIREASKLIDEGYVLAVKGYGGYHIATSTLNPEPIRRVREAKHRRWKPFAIMARDIETVKGFAKVGREEEELLRSYMRPILLLEKGEGYYLAEEISPGLDTIGVMLPYSALHVMMFMYSREPAFVMTSANPSGEPIVKDEEDAFRRLVFADYFLIHNRRIAHRCDDSVAKMNSGFKMLIRRSRGYSPSPIRVKWRSREDLLSLGAELNVTTGVMVGDKVFLSQHIGDMESLENYEFMKEATDHLIRLVNAKIGSVACDLHPKMLTTKYAEALADRMGIKPQRVQHHHAHAATIMGEYGLDEIVCVAADGIGYGSDSKIWGGEVMHVDLTGFERAYHIEELPMTGGDLSTYYPIRMLASILFKEGVGHDFLAERADMLPRGEEELDVIEKQVKRGEYIPASSTGRALDAVAAMLDLCYERTYEGEPAMRLEAMAMRGKDGLRLEPRIRGGILMIGEVIAELFELRDRVRREDIARSFHEYIARGFATMAIELAREEGVKYIGFTGGVAYNRIIASVMKSMVEEEGMKLLMNELVPAGDGGIAFGQALVTAWKGLI